MGPAGGIVFYDKGFYSDGWRYLEVTQHSISQDRFGYHRPRGKNEMIGTSKSIGSGRINTERLVLHMDQNGQAYSNNSGDSLSSYAARSCYDYSINDFDDWFLPSMMELECIYRNLKLGVYDDFTYRFYLSSCERSSTVFEALSTYNGTNFTSLEERNYHNGYVYAVRAF